MKKKGARAIPDFSSKRRAVLPDAASAPQAVHGKPRREPIAKPQATSIKSGRRGQ